MKAEKYVFVMTTSSSDTCEATSGYSSALIEPSGQQGVLPRCVPVRKVSLTSSGTSGELKSNGTASTTVPAVLL